MKLNILASGSQGNCIALSSGNTTILIDAGIAKTKIEKRLLEVGIRPDHISAIFITHAHGDHIKGLPLANKFQIPVFAGLEEWKDIKVSIDAELMHNVSSDKSIQIKDDFEIGAFKTHHDALESYGYVVTDDKEKCSICLDTGHADSNMVKAMYGSDIYIIEANHEPNMVEASDYPISVQARILSHIGHLSNEQTAIALSKLIQGRGERIYLTHLSHKNNLPALAEMTVKRTLTKQGFKAGTHYEIEVI
ncbi:MBL fold metallo-hydrolase [Alkalihalophilus lindianensis]|uniref:MBL fold metallo-hydrolase n=1 Tax=Alkalihalophilus lindianensis TaxID=1630542 RepID=A0ABU3X7P2_9BACI|nr:MBL fold metallo-hydrolase [Alkalihalophilus lindianensis]MDV2683767.1 MBL fold metallo-hydrolase [Alkalihalophilus lindianensis]MDV2683833.1 MBL fold metallo-hydrolase [Alkalihalophilus lindianensis]